MPQKILLLNHSVIILWQKIFALNVQSFTYIYIPELDLICIFKFIYAARRLLFIFVALVIIFISHAQLHAYPIKGRRQCNMQHFFNFATLYHFFLHTYLHCKIKRIYRVNQEVIYF